MKYIKKVILNTYKKIKLIKSSNITKTKIKIK